MNKSYCWRQPILIKIEGESWIIKARNLRNVKIDKGRGQYIGIFNVLDENILPQGIRSTNATSLEAKLPFKLSARGVWGG